MENQTFYIIAGVSSIILPVGACNTGHDLSVNDFKFDGAPGSERAVIEKSGRNHFKITLDHAPDQPEWSNKLNFEITDNANNKTIST